MGSFFSQNQSLMCPSGKTPPFLTRILGLRNCSNIEAELYGQYGQFQASRHFKRQEPQMMLPKMITSPLPPGTILSIWRGQYQGPQQQSELSGWSCKRG